VLRRHRDQCIIDLEPKNDDLIRLPINRIIVPEVVNYFTQRLALRASRDPSKLLTEYIPSQVNRPANLVLLLDKAASYSPILFNMYITRLFRLDQVT